MRRVKKIWIVFGIVLGMLSFGVVGGAFYINHIINLAMDKMVTTESITHEEADVDQSMLEKERQSKVINVALFGVDNRNQALDAGNSYSDAIKILSIDSILNKATITSLQRDTLIYVPEPINDFDKLNHAYRNGGAQLALRTINYNFDLDVTRYITLNFRAVEKIVDIIGGITLTLTEEEVKVTNDYIKHLNNLDIDGIETPYLTEVGEQVLTGRQTMGYMRDRYTGNSDFVRMQRQNNVIKEIIKKTKELNYDQLLQILNESLPFVETNLTKKEFIEFGLKALQIDFNNIEQVQIPKGAESDSIRVEYNGFKPLFLVNDYQQMVRDVHAGIYSDLDYQPSDRIVTTEASINETFSSFE